MSIHHTCRRIAIVLCVAFLPPVLSGAPPAEEILGQARKALGNVGGIKSLSLAGERRINAETPEGSRTMARQVEMDFLLPDRFLKAETMDLPGGLPGPTLVEALDGENSWRDTRNAPAGGNVVIVTRTPGTGPGGEPDPNAGRARTRTMRANYLRQILLLTLTPPPGVEIKFDVLGEAEAPDGKAWIVDASGPDQFALRIFIDQQSHLPLMASWRGLAAGRPVVRMVRGTPGAKAPDAGALPEPPKPKEVEFELRVADYSRFGGVLLPKTMTLSSEGSIVDEFEIKSAKINPNLKPEKFRQ